MPDVIMQCFNNFLEIFITLSQTCFHFIKPKELLNTFQTYHFLLCKTKHCIDFVCVHGLAEFNSVNINIFTMYYFYWKKTSICVPKESRYFSMFSKTGNTEVKVISFFFYTLFNKAEIFFLRQQIVPFSQQM